MTINDPRPNLALPSQMSPSSAASQTQASPFDDNRVFSYRFVRAARMALQGEHTSTQLGQVCFQYTRSRFVLIGW